MLCVFHYALFWGFALASTIIREFKDPLLISIGLFSSTARGYAILGLVVYVCLCNSPPVLRYLSGRLYSGRVWLYYGAVAVLCMNARDCLLQIGVIERGDLSGRTVVTHALVCLMALGWMEPLRKGVSFTTFGCGLTGPALLKDMANSRYRDLR